MADTQHLAPFALMRHLTGELPAAERRRAGEHLAVCLACRTALDELRAVKERGASEAPPAPFPARPPATAPRPRRWRLAWGAPVAAAVALAVAVIWLGPRPAAVRPKGGGGSVRVTAACKHEQRTWSCKSGERLQPGTAIMIQVDLDAERDLLVLGRDGSARWRSYIGGAGDGGGRRSLRLPRGRQQLPHSLVLDARPGPERFYVIDAPGPISEWSAIAGLEQGGLGDGVGVTELVFDK
jgi:hypothetical protein